MDHVHPCSIAVIAMLNNQMVHSAREIVQLWTCLPLPPLAFVVVVVGEPTIPATGGLIPLTPFEPTCFSSFKT